MSTHDADVTLRQIVEVCDKAVELRNATTWEEFRGDWRKQMLGERLVEILGEAVKRLPDDLRTRHPQLPWKKIAGTRDYIAHGYDNVDYEVIWGVLDVEADKLKESVLAILAKEFPEPPAPAAS
ncbi:MAG TPA: HepT-like ribonuclease domain-containing protein [Verrucomicrobiae bacterium]|nr:HepT-like ribonuclease domain-containing protein [Verrucomicrobiae bacterium]HEV2436926.1 HepT-like ribonuclease domain-containing protein [Verrucomicrobiae bacterium]